MKKIPEKQLDEIVEAVKETHSKDGIDNRVAEGIHIPAENVNDSPRQDNIAKLAKDKSLVNRRSEILAAAGVAA